MRPLQWKDATAFQGTDLQEPSFGDPKPCWISAVGCRRQGEIDLRIAFTDSRIANVIEERAGKGVAIRVMLPLPLGRLSVRICGLKASLPVARR